MCILFSGTSSKFSINGNIQCIIFANNTIDGHWWSKVEMCYVLVILNKGTWRIGLATDCIAILTGVLGSNPDDLILHFHGNIIVSTLLM